MANTQPLPKFDPNKENLLVNKQIDRNMSGSNPATISKQALYSRLQTAAPRAIESLIHLIDKELVADNTRLTAINMLLSRVLPEVKQVELTGKDGQALQIQIKIDVSGGYIPAHTLYPTNPAQIGSNGPKTVENIVEGTLAHEEDSGDNGDTV